jgi:hypothetical protein
MAKIGANCFPDVLAVMQDIEGNTGLQPVACMVDKGSVDRVAYSIDMSVDLGNASHYDVGDVSQGFLVWTEEVPSLAANCFFCDAKCMWHEQWNPIQWCCYKAIPWYIHLLGWSCHPSLYIDDFS